MYVIDEGSLTPILTRLMALYKFALLRSID